MSGSAGRLRAAAGWRFRRTYPARGHGRKSSPPQPTESFTEAGRAIAQREITLPALLTTAVPVTVAVTASSAVKRPVSFQLNWPLRPLTLPKSRSVAFRVAEKRPARTRTDGLAASVETHASWIPPPLHLPSKPMRTRNFELSRVSVSIVIRCSRGKLIVPERVAPGFGTTSAAAAVPTVRSETTKAAIAVRMVITRTYPSMALPNTVHRAEPGHSSSHPARVHSRNGPDSPPDGDDRVSSVPDVLRSRDRAGELREGALPL